MDKNANWTVADIRKYAISQYNLEEGFNESEIAYQDNYDKAIRRCLLQHNLVKSKKDDNGNEVYNYTVTEDVAKMVVDKLMHNYFVKHENSVKIEKAFAEMDEKLNIEHIRLIDELQSEELENGSISSTFNYEKMNVDIDRFMLRGIFDIFFSFDEESYIADYEERQRLYNEFDSPTPYQEGFSKLNYKLTHPLQFYCHKR